MSTSYFVRITSNSGEDRDLPETTNRDWAIQMANAQYDNSNTLRAVVYEVTSIYAVTPP